jgi:hypothetical protein
MSDQTTGTTPPGDEPPDPVEEPIGQEEGTHRLVDPGREIPPMVGAVVVKTSRFSREVVATMIALSTAALGFVAALAWNTAITTAFQHWLKNPAKKVTALFIYAAVVTLIGVIVIVLLARLAARINAEPIQFKYPGSPKR